MTATPLDYTAELLAAVREIVDRAPKVTAAQLDLIAAVLRPLRGEKVRAA